MSDTPQGPGWWLASDGKYYPPNTPPVGSPLPPPGSPPIAPAAPPTQPLAPQPHFNTPPRSVSPGLSGTLQGFGWAACGIAILTALLAIGNLIAFNQWWDSPIGSAEEADALDELSTLEDGLAGLGGIMTLVELVVFVLMLIWANQAHKATQGIWPGPRKWSSGWTIGGWFIPFANLVIPKLVLNEIERIAFSPRSNGYVGEGWRRRSTMIQGWIWWLGIIVGYILNAIGNLLVGGGEARAGEVRAGRVFNAVGLTLVAIGAGYGALYVRRITSRLTADGLRQQP